MENINTKDKNKAIMQIHLDQTDAEIMTQDLKEYAATLSNALGYNTAEILEEMARHDLDHMINIFNKHFSEYIELLDSDVIIQRSKK